MRGPFFAQSRGLLTIKRTSNSNSEPIASIRSIAGERPINAKFSVKNICNFFINTKLHLILEMMIGIAATMICKEVCKGSDHAVIICLKQMNKANDLILPVLFFER